MIEREKKICPPKAEKPFKVILDSSFLFIPVQFNIDIFEELTCIINRRFEPIILSTTHEELEKIVERKSTKLHRQAVFALSLTQRCRQIEVKRGYRESYDDSIVRVASEMKCAVATNDRVLRKKLRNMNVPVIYLRQKSHLAVDGLI